MFNKIKASLRNNPFYVSHLQKNINDFRYFIKNLLFYFNHFRFSGKKIEGNTLFFVIDPKQHHPGLADRLKVICCIYYIAKINDFKFKLIFDAPFKLQDYLVCNKVDWYASIDDIQFSFKTTRMLAYNGMGKIPTLRKKINQYVIYYYIGRDILNTNKINNHDEILRNCFHELFKPSEILENSLKNMCLTPKQYNAVHLRFVNALEKFEDGVYNCLSVKEQELLINKCLNCLKDIKENCKKDIVVFSDSNRFLSIAKKNGYKVLDGTVSHISFNNNNDAVLKTFTDFYMISRSDKVYRIISKEMYGTTFSLYASIFGNCEFKTIRI